MSAALITTFSLAPTALEAQEHNYHDQKHNDDHKWDSHEDKAYRIYVKQNHRHYQSFERIKEEDRQSYWAWRHEHSDALLKIEIR
jgi:hypothetical protein